MAFRPSDCACADPTKDKLKRSLENQIDSFFKKSLQQWCLLSAYFPFYPYSPCQLSKLNLPLFQLWNPSLDDRWSTPPFKEAPFPCWMFCSLRSLFWGQMISSAICPRIVSTAISQPWPSILQPVTVCVVFSYPSRWITSAFRFHEEGCEKGWSWGTWYLGFSEGRLSPPPNRTVEVFLQGPTSAFFCLITARFSTACHSFLRKCAVLFLLWWLPHLFLEIADLGFFLLSQVLLFVMWFLRFETNFESSLQDIKRPFRFPSRSVVLNLSNTATLLCSSSWSGNPWQ